MAKITHPLFSFAASGTVGPLNVQPAYGKHIARRSARQSVKRTSPAQAARRLRFSNASAAWDALDEITRDRWRGRAITPNHRGGLNQTAPYYNGRAHFIREYLIQMCSPPTIPLIPSL